MSTKKILIVDDEEPVIELINVLLSSIDDVELITATSGNDAISILEHTDNITLVISDYRMANGSGLDLYNHICENFPSVSFILTSVIKPNEIEGLDNFLFDRPNNNFINKSALPSKLAQTTEEILAEPGWKRAGFKKLEIDHFFNIQYHNAEIFLQLSEDKFVKIAHSTEEAKKDLLSKYKDRNVKHVFILHNNYKKMLRFEFIHIEGRLKKVKNATTDVMVEAQADASETIHECLKIMGLSREKFKPILELVNSCLGSYNKGLAFSELFSNLSKKENIQAKLSLLVAYLAVGISSKFKAELDFPPEPIIMAALLQDIYLPDDESTLICSLSSDEFTSSGSKERELIEIHPYLAARVLHKNSERTHIVEELIQNHHERPKGKGFPEQKSLTALSPLSIIYILANDFASRLLKSKLTKKDMDQIFNQLAEEYGKGAGKKSYEAFLRLFNKKVPGEEKRVF